MSMTNCGSILVTVKFQTLVLRNAIDPDYISDPALHLEKGDQFWLNALECDSTGLVQRCGLFSTSTHICSFHNLSQREQASENTKQKRTNDMQDESHPSKRRKIDLQ